MFEYFIILLNRQIRYEDMRNLFLFILLCFSVSGCDNDVEFNTPAIQGNLNGEFWKATNYKANIYNGGLLIEGNNTAETLLFVTDNATRGTYKFGPNSANEARFVDADGIVYSTKNAPDESLTPYPSDGEIIIESFDYSVSPRTVTGIFWFNAYSNDGLKSINFNKGQVYNVAFVGVTEDGD